MQHQRSKQSRVIHLVTTTEHKIGTDYTEITLVNSNTVE